MIYLLDVNEIMFPHPSLSMEDGLLALGGDLHPNRLLMAYDWGIFPWDTIPFEGKDYIAWFAPNERFVIHSHKIKISKSMQRIMKHHPYTIKVNTAFKQVMRECMEMEREGQEGGSWITEEVIRSYTELRRRRRAMSVEVFEGEELVGGLYGVMVGKIFCGESMFSKKPNTSKLALIWLAQHGGFEIIDCQFRTEHFVSMGGESMSLAEYLGHLGRY